MTLPLEWFRGVPQDKHESIEKVIRNSTIALGRIKYLIDEWEKELNSAEAKIDDYNNPSWSHKQAHRNGDRARLRKLRDLLSFLNGEKHG